MDDNRAYGRDLKLLNLIIEHFIPHEEVSKLESKLVFSEEVDDWVLNIKIIYR